jgi:nucleoside-diphosphate-sugar epimerase
MMGCSNVRQPGPRQDVQSEIDGTMTERPRVLVTGGAGFIGRKLIERLVREGECVTVLDIAEPRWHLPGVHFITGDVRDPIAVRAALAPCDRVFHLAAAHHDFGLTEATYFSVNRAGTRVLLDVMSSAGLRDIVFMSSVAVFGEGTGTRYEGSAKEPTHPYGLSKLAGEKEVTSWFSSRPDRRALILRPTITFGPGNYANMYSLIRQIDVGPFLRIGAGTNYKSLVCVQNVIEAALLLWRNAPDGQLVECNLVDKPDMTSAEIISTIYRALGRRPPPVGLPLSLAEAMLGPAKFIFGRSHGLAQVSRERVRKLAASETMYEGRKLREFGFRPVCHLVEGLQQMVDWYVREGRSSRQLPSLPPSEPVPWAVEPAAIYVVDPGGPSQRVVTDDG